MKSIAHCSFDALTPAPLRAAFIVGDSRPVAQRGARGGATAVDEKIEQLSSAVVEAVLSSKFSKRNIALENLQGHPAILRDIDLPFDRRDLSYVDDRDPHWS